MTRTMKPGMPKIAREWVQGPPITAPAEDLAAWLAAQAPRLVRVAFTLDRDAHGFTSRSARIGALTVQINDAALGVGIADRARRCEHAVCAFISEAYWEGGVLSLRDTSQRPISAGELAAFTHLEVEGETAN